MQAGCGDKMADELQINVSFNRHVFSLPDVNRNPMVFLWRSGNLTHTLTLHIFHHYSILLLCAIYYKTCRMPKAKIHHFSQNTFIYSLPTLLKGTLNSNQPTNQLYLQDGLLILPTVDTMTTTTTTSV